MLRRHKKRKRESAVADEEAGWGSAADLIDDTLSSIQLITDRNAQGFEAAGLPPLVVWHQLYTIFPNRTFVDQNINRLRNAGKLVAFKIPSGSADMVVLQVADFIAETQKWQRLFRRQLTRQSKPAASERRELLSKMKALAAFGRAVPRLSSLATISMTELLAAMGAKSDDRASSADEQELEIRAMVGLVQRLGFLLSTTHLEDEAFHLSLPGIGKLISALKKTRTLVLSTLKRTKYKEMHEQQLQKVKLKHSHFQLEFHLADMEGCGLVRRTKVTSGVLVTLVDK